MTIEGIDLTWLGHASLKAKAEGTVVYFDPWKLPQAACEPADLVLVTHSHSDHCSPADVKRIAGSDTLIVTVADCAERLPGRVKTLTPGQKTLVAGLTVEAVPAYNIGKAFHPKQNGWVGFLVDLGGKRLYHAGDTDFIPEMKEVRCDVAFLPCGGKYTMTAAEAAQAADAIRPTVAVPMHYGDLVGSAADARRFEEQCDCRVVILPSAR